MNGNYSGEVETDKMKKSCQKSSVVIAVALCLVFLLCSCSRLDKQTDYNPLKHNAALKEELTVTFQTFQNALKSSDVEALKALVHADYFGFSQDGQKHGIEQLLSVWGSGDLQLDKLEYKDLDVRVTGDMGFVSGTAQIAGRHVGRGFESHLRFMDVWLHDGHRWHLYASMATELGHIPGPVIEE